jgi:hypothetical protein
MSKFRGKGLPSWEGHEVEREEIEWLLDFVETDRRLDENTSDSVDCSLMLVQRKAHFHCQYFDFQIQEINQHAFLILPTSNYKIK